MRSMIRVAAVLALTAGVTTAYTQSTVLTATATFIDVAGKPIGKATLTQTPNGLLIDFDVSGLPPGERAMHVHEVGRCDGAGAFQSAGGHFALQSKAHGFHSPTGPHAGDLPNQFVAADGKLRGHAIAPALTLAGGAGSVFDADGSAIVVHAKADDYRSQPAGDAGGRIACAVIERGPPGAGATASQPR